MMGHPAKVHAWVCECAKTLEFKKNVAKCTCGKKYQLAANKKSIKKL